MYIDMAKLSTIKRMKEKRQKRKSIFVLKTQSYILIKKYIINNLIDAC